MIEPDSRIGLTAMAKLCTVTRVIAPKSWARSQISLYRKPFVGKLAVAPVIFSEVFCRPSVGSTGKSSDSR
jgi:hypothetical protein